MRTKIDYGIDLGTTNSAIARIENGNPKVIKSDTLKDTTPSCVNINIKQDILVGDTAVSSLLRDRTKALKTWKKEESNTFLEFKRTMGTDTKYPSSNAHKEFSSEQLSAEVLMKLKSLLKDESLKSIVITVPAKFTIVQKSATVEAGKLAGFQHIELLQEPIAASMAYGLDATNRDGVWLVFDFGGGTFDAAIIRVEDGIMKVIDTDGDNWLGGKNIDYAIVDQIIIPYLKTNFSIEEILNDTDKKEILRNALKSYAEDCKIQMSFKDTHNILTDLGDLPFEDENGDEPSLDIQVTNVEMQNVVGPFFQKAIDICKDLLKRNNLKGSQLSTLLPVGGPTHSPILKKMLKEQITDQVNTSIDPMTSVAAGAALYASTINVSKQIIEQSRDKTKIQLEIKHEPTTVELVEMVNIKILRDKTTGQIPAKVFTDVVRGDKAWSSGKVLISEKATLVDVMLKERAFNSFEVDLYDEQGNKLDCQPNSFNILQGINPGHAVLPYHIGIEITDRIQGKDLLTAIKGLEKNQTIPATGVTKGLRTQKAIRPGMVSDFIVIPIYQGDYYAEDTTAIHSTHVNDVVITGETLPAILPAGSEVEITVKIDRSEQMSLSVFFPYLNHTEELAVNIIKEKQIGEDWLATEINKAKKTARKLNSDDTLNKLEELEHQLETDKVDPDGKFKILENLRKELRTLDTLEQKTEWPKVEKELKGSFYALEDLLKEVQNSDTDHNLNMNLVDAHMQEFRQRIEQIIKTKDIKLGKELIQEIRQLDFALRDAASGGMMDVMLVQHINDDFSKIKWKDSGKARVLLNQAIQSINGGKIGNIRSLVDQIIDVMDRESAKEFTDKLTR
jgi:molecular chaperone DnaK